MDQRPSVTAVLKRVTDIVFDCCHTIINSDVVLFIIFSLIA